VTAWLDRRTAAREPAPPDSRRLISVGIRDLRIDGAALRWALFDAIPGADVVQVVHAYQPVHGEAFEGWGAVSTAVEAGARHSADVAIIGSPFPGDPEIVLQARSAEAAILVLGDDEPASPQHRIAAHLQRTAHCPVICVPRGAEVIEDKPVTVVADELGLSDAALDFACDYALRHAVTLDIARTWRSLHRDEPLTAAALADEQAQLDAEFSDLRTRHPHVAIASRIELDPSWLDRARAHSSLIVVSRQTAVRLGITTPLPTPLCPVAVIPDVWVKAT
jgi:hypothetical protein